jgi:hypothetical protein
MSRAAECRIGIEIAHRRAMICSDPGEFDYSAAAGGNRRLRQT